MRSLIGTASFGNEADRDAAIAHVEAEAAAAGLEPRAYDFGPPAGEVTGVAPFVLPVDAVEADPTNDPPIEAADAREDPALALAYRGEDEPVGALEDALYGWLEPNGATDYTLGSSAARPAE